MKITTLLIGTALIGLTSLAAFSIGTPALAEQAPAPAATTTEPAAFTDAQKAAIEEVVRDLLTKKEPEIIAKAAQEMQAKQEAESNQKAQKALIENKDKIYNDPNTPIGGNPKGDVTIVEFFDYRCGYCKMANENVAKLMQSDKNVRYIFKEYPILGPLSKQVSKIALASVKQNKYEKFHLALMAAKENLTEEAVFKIAKEVGLDVDKLKKDMNDEEIAKAIEANVSLGQAVGARGTPTFIIDGKVYPGALQFEQMKNLVENARKNAKK